MICDLRLFTTKSKVEYFEKLQRPSTWGMTEAERKKCPNSSQKRVPVIISTDSILSSPEALKDFLYLPSTPEVVHTTSTTFDEDPRDVQTSDVQISDVSFHDYCKLWKRTEGEFICVWFQEKWMYGWFARSLKIEKRE